MKLISMTKANDGKHKYTAVFDINGKSKTTHFGAVGYKDFIQYSKQDKSVAEMKKNSYLARHKVNEDWSDPTKAGTLSKYILWSEPSFSASLAKYKKHFKL
jgi:hypothetical protein